MPRELLARAQATIAAVADAYTITQSTGEYIFPAASDGTILAPTSVETTIQVTQGGQDVDFTIGAVPKPPGFDTLRVDNTAKSVTFTVAAGTRELSDHGSATIPLNVAGHCYRLAYVWSKARSGAAGTDANMLDWVQEWNTGRTVIDQSTVITPKLFAGVRHEDGTLTGTAIGCYGVRGHDAAGRLESVQVEGISGFHAGRRTFLLDSTGNVQLGRGEQFVRYNAITGQVEFGAEVSLQWAGATYIDRQGIFTGTLSATTLETLHLDARQITTGKISAERLDVDSLRGSLVTASHIESLTLDVRRGRLGGWSVDDDAIYRGAMRNLADVYAPSGSMTIGSTGLRGAAWRLEASGAGALAGGNICWDAAGQVVFSRQVSLQWSAPLESITAALGGEGFPRLTRITADGIYTGALTAVQITSGTLAAERIAAGSLHAEKLDAASVRTTLINAEYISGLSCSFTRGTLGGWTIGPEHIEAAGAATLELRTAPHGGGSWHEGAYRPFGISMRWQQCGGGHIVLGDVAEDAGSVKQGFAGLQMMNAQGNEYFCLAARVLGGDTQVYNRIAGWSFDHECIWKNDVILGADGTIAHAGMWRLGNDGSGELAAGNIRWDAAGAVTFAPSVALHWSAPLQRITTALGGETYPRLTSITAQGLYTGSITAQQITAGTLAVERLDAAAIRTQIVDTDYISSLACDFTRGTIGGWHIHDNAITGGIANSGRGFLRLTLSASFADSVNWQDGSCPPMGCSMIWSTPGSQGHLVLGQVARQDGLTRQGYVGLQMINRSKEYFCLAANHAGSGDNQTYNRIAGWAFDHERIWKNNVILAADGSITNGNMWQLRSDGSGRLAGGSILWDAAGRVTFAPEVSLNWQASLEALTDALGGGAYAKLTHITDKGLYTGTISASQILVDTELVVGGQDNNGSVSVRDATGAVMVTLDRSGIKAVGGRIGGWIINAQTICAAAPDSGHRIYLTSSGYLYNDNPTTAKDYWGLKPDGSATFGYGTIRFERDGAGFLAARNIRWDAAGNVELEGTITATGGSIAGFIIQGNKLLNNAANSSIEFSSLTGQASLIVNGASALLSLRADSDRTGIFIQTYAPGAKGLQIIANCGSDYAIESYGPVILGQRASEKWNVPGVLYIGCKYSEGHNNNYRKIWGDGVVISSFQHIGNAQYRVEHNLYHTNYTVFAQQWMSPKYYGFFRLLERGITHFVIQNVGAAGKPDSAPFDFIIYGQNTF